MGITEKIATQFSGGVKVVRDGEISVGNCCKLTPSLVESNLIPKHHGERFGTTHFGFV